MYKKLNYGKSSINPYISEFLFFAVMTTRFSFNVKACNQRIY